MTYSAQISGAAPRNPKCWCRQPSMANPTAVLLLTLARCLLHLQPQSSLDLLGLPGSPTISWQVKMAYFEGEADSPLVCSSLHQHPPCSARLLPAWCLCCALNVPPLMKFFNYCFSLWNASWSLGLLIPSDWKGEENPLNNFLTPPRGFPSGPSTGHAMGAAEQWLAVSAQLGISTDCIFPAPTECFSFPVSSC